MSVRAYRIITLKVEKTPAFNLWLDEKFMEYLRRADCLAHLNDSGSGQIEIPIAVYKKGLKYLDEESREQALLDIKTCKMDGYVQYECY